MHYYKRNLGDYAKKAGRLSILEHGVYNLLIDACYDREKFPTEEEAIDWTWARTDEEIEAVKFVIKKFFTLENGFYVQTRIKEELNEYHAMGERNTEIARKREAKRKPPEQVVNGASTERKQVVNGASPNQEPITINQEPITNNPTQNTLVQNSNSEPENPKNDEGLKSKSQKLIGEIAQALKSEGMSATGMNLQSPVVAELIAKGATPAMFAGAYRDAVDKGKTKPFPWALEKLKGEFSDAARLHAQARASPKKPRSFNDVSLAEAVAQQQAQAQEYQALEADL